MGGTEWIKIPTDSGVKKVSTGAKDWVYIISGSDIYCDEGKISSMCGGGDGGNGSGVGNLVDDLR